MIYLRKMPEGLTRKEMSDFAQMLLKDALKKEYRLSELPEIHRSSYGKPYFLNYPEIHFNYSHCRNGVVCALSKSEIGIDMETVRKYSEKTAKRFCSEREWAWLNKQDNLDKEWIHIWTMKEAYVKYTGAGIRMDLRCIDMADVLMSQTEESVKVWVGQEETVHIQSIFENDSWITVCGIFEKEKTIYCI